MEIALRRHNSFKEELPMSILKPVVGDKTTTISIKLPKSLHQRLNDLKKSCKERGFILDTQAETVKALEHIVEKAEKELQGMGQKPASRGSNS
jgi:hypothetical protein